MAQRRIVYRVESSLGAALLISSSSAQSSSRRRFQTLLLNSRHPRNILEPNPVQAASFKRIWAIQCYQTACAVAVSENLLHARKSRHGMPCSILHLRCPPCPRPSGTILSSTVQPWLRHGQRLVFGVERRTGQALVPHLFHRIARPRSLVYDFNLPSSP